MVRQITIQHIPQETDVSKQWCKLIDWGHFEPKSDNENFTGHWTLIESSK